jgi:DNA-directed RNA polymerase subunit omega
MVPPQVSSVARKPLSIGFEEIAADKIVRTEWVPAAEVEVDTDGEHVAEPVGLPEADPAPADATA